MPNMDFGEAILFGRDCFRSDIVVLEVPRMGRYYAVVLSLLFCRAFGRREMPE